MIVEYGVDNLSIAGSEPVLCLSERLVHKPPFPAIIFIGLFAVIPPPSGWFTWFSQ
jgi:hypothetical protein